MIEVLLGAPFLHYAAGCLLHSFLVVLADLLEKDKDSSLDGLQLHLSLESLLTDLISFVRKIAFLGCTTDHLRQGRYVGCFSLARAAFHLKRCLLLTDIAALLALLRIGYRLFKVAIEASTGGSRILSAARPRGWSTREHNLRVVAGPKGTG